MSETQTCATCSGSGEGQYEFTKCRTCKGSGVDPQSMTVQDIADKVTDKDGDYYYLDPNHMVEAMELIYSNPEMMSQFRNAIEQDDANLFYDVCKRISLKYWTDHLISLGL